MEIKEKVKPFDLTSLLGYPDSNQERQDQNLQCYHYTIPQSNIKNGVYREALLSNTGAKVTLYYKPAKFCGVFFLTICPTAPQDKPLLKYRI